MNMEFSFFEVKVNLPTWIRKIFKLVDHQVITVSVNILSLKQRYNMSKQGHSQILKAALDNQEKEILLSYLG